MFANSEEVDNPTAMETDDKTDDRELSKNKVEEAEVDDTDAVESGDNEDDDNEESGVLQDRSNIEKSEGVEGDTADTPSKEEATKLFRFPQGRIKSIMKLDPDVGMVNGEAIIQCLAAESYHYTQSSKKKTIMKEHVMTAIESIDELAFLDGAMD